MKAMVCEMCNSNDIQKQDGVYVCQHCGTKYSVEEARKLMIEGSVDVSGSTVKVDNTAFVEKYLANARRAKQKEDWEETEKYYNLVEQNNPTNIEAIFYSAYGKAKVSLVESDIYKRKAAFKVLQNCVSIIDDNFDMDKEAEEKEIIKQISDDIIAMACSSYVYNQTKNGYGVVTRTDEMDTVTLFNQLSGEFITTLQNISNKYEDDKQTIFFYKLMIKHADWVLRNGSLADPSSYRELLDELNMKLNGIDPTHKAGKYQFTITRQKQFNGSAGKMLISIDDGPEFSLKSIGDSNVVTLTQGPHVIVITAAMWCFKGKKLRISFSVNGEAGIELSFVGDGTMSYNASGKIEVLQASHI